VRLLGLGGASLRRGPRFTPLSILTSASITCASGLCADPDCQRE
jgi:hypothetical protein